eukprot:881808-Rhodomonas_salina.3
MREQDPAASTSVAVIDAVVALAESSDAFLCIDAVVASGSVLGMELSAGKTFPSAQRRTPNPESSAASGQTGQADAEEDANKRSGAVGLVEVAPVALGLCLTNVAGGIGAGAANLPLGISTGAAFVCSLALFYFGHLLAGELKSFLVSDKVCAVQRSSLGCGPDFLPLITNTLVLIRDASEMDGDDSAHAISVVQRRAKPCVDISRRSSILHPEMPCLSGKYSSPNPNAIALPSDVRCSALVSAPWRSIQSIRWMHSWPQDQGVQVSRAGAGE